MSDLENETLSTIGLDVESVEDGWEIIRVKVHIDDWTNDGLWCDGSMKDVSRMFARPHEINCDLP